MRCLGGGGSPFFCRCFKFVFIMKRYFFAILFSVASLFSACAQEEPVDPKAKAVLDKAVAKFSSKKGVEALFDISLENEQNGKKRDYQRLFAT